MSRNLKEEEKNNAHTTQGIKNGLTREDVNVAEKLPHVVKYAVVHLGNDNIVQCPVWDFDERCILPFPMPAPETISLKHNGEFHKYYKMYCGFDIETTNVEQNAKHLAFMYHWQFIISDDECGHVFLGRTWAAFFNLIKRLEKYYNLNNYIRIIVWDSNLGFEHQFIRKYFDWDPDDFFAREERHPMKARTNGFEFHEALTISGGSLAQLAKDYTFTQKLTGDLDYSIQRNSKTVLTSEELDYCINDVVILAEWSKYIFYNYIIPDKRIPLTKTGILRTETRQTLIDMKGNDGARIYRKLIYEAFPSEQVYEKWFRWLFRGGYVHANCLMCGFEIKDVDGYDITSSYPAVMNLYDEYPLTPFKKTNYDPEYLKTHACIMRVTFINIKRKWAHSIESKSKAIELEGSGYMPIVIDNGRIAQAAKLTVMITNIDFEIYKKFYTWESMKVSEFSISARGFLPLFIRRTLNRHYMEKDNLKRSGKSDTPEYVIAKQRVNSMYGMTVTRIELDKVSYDNDADEWKVLEKELDFSEEIKSQFLLPQWGIWVTALARRALLNVTALITEQIGDGSGEDGAGVIYNDTDSIKVYDPSGKAKKIIEAYNYQIQQRLKAVKLTHEAFKTLGTYDFEDHYQRFKTLGAKRYLTESNGKIKATIAGLPKKAILNFDGDPFDAFDLDGMTLQADVSLKKTISYNDEHTEAIVDGELMQEESSAGIYDISFSMNLDKAYYVLITEGMLERVRKYGD